MACITPVSSFLGWYSLADSLSRAGSKLLTAQNIAGYLAPAIRPWGKEILGNRITGWASFNVGIASHGPLGQQGKGVGIMFKVFAECKDNPMLQSLV
jgi:hypothetical protein